MAVRLDFNCNDPDHGNFLGRFCMMQVECGDIDLNFEGPWWPPSSPGVTIRFASNHTWVGRLKIPTFRYKQLYGNWCWDSIWTDWPNALKVINYLGKLKAQGWHCAEGNTVLYEAFNERKEITPQEWKAALTP